MSKTYMQEVIAQSSEPVEAQDKNAWQCKKITYESYVKNLKKSSTRKLSTSLFSKKKLRHIKNRDAMSIISII